MRTSAGETALQRPQMRVQVSLEIRLVVGVDSPVASSADTGKSSWATRSSWGSMTLSTKQAARAYGQGRVNARSGLG